MNRIGVRHEDKNRWERRTPLTPEAVGSLIANYGIDIRVEASPKRVFSDAEYAAVGATVVDNLTDCKVVLAVKEIPMHLVAADTTYVFFSHTVKGQPHAMPLLNRLLDTGATLIDYEPIVDASGHRLVHFGRFAGLAGMVDALWAFGQRWQALGVDTPFLGLAQAFTYDSLAQALDAVGAVGRQIASNGLPERVGPLVVGVTGYGNVSQGACEVLDLLPRIDVAAAELTAEFIAVAPSTGVYVTTFTEQDTVARIDGAAFDAADCRADPGAFRSIFSPSAAQLSILVNGVLWQPEAPRLLTKRDLGVLLADSSRLSLIADLSCDIEGGIEATVRATTSDDPVFTFDPTTGAAPSGFTGPGVTILAVDNLPCEFSRDASAAFSSSLQSLVPALAAADFTVPFADLNLPPELLNAVVTHRGALTPRFAFLAEEVAASHE